MTPKARLAEVLRYKEVPPDSSQVSALHGLLSAPEPVLRRASADVLSHACEFFGLALPEAWGADFARLCRDPDASVRAEACAALALIRLEGPGLDRPPLLLHALKDPDAGVRQEAAAALGDLTADLLGPHGLEVQAALTAGLSDPDAGVRFEAAFALAGHGRPEGVPVLTATLGDPSLRSDAIEGLRRSGSPEAIDALTALNKRWRLPWHERLAAAAARLELGDEDGAKPLMTALRSWRFEVQSFAVFLLGRARHPPALDALEARARRSGPMRPVALKALAHWNPPGLESWLRERLEDPREPDSLRADLVEAGLGSQELLKRLEASGPPAVQGAARRRLREDAPARPRT